MAQCLGSQICRVWKPTWSVCAADYDSKDKETRKAVKEMAKWLFAVKSCGHTLDMYDPGTYGPDVHEQKHGLVFACYQRLLKIRSLMDFDDHLSKACLLRVTGV